MEYKGAGWEKLGDIIPKRENSHNPNAVTSKNPNVAGLNDLKLFKSMGIINFLPQVPFKKCKITYICSVSIFKH